MKIHCFESGLNNLIKFREIIGIHIQIIGFSFHNGIPGKYGNETGNSQDYA